VDDIEATIPKVEQHGGSITDKKTLIDENLGWWAGFKDPAGNAMYLYESAHKHPH
jgi:predicted enzyme related to lactoylglutathione lyase